MLYDKSGAFKLWCARKRKGKGMPSSTTNSVGARRALFLLLSGPRKHGVDLRSAEGRRRKTKNTQYGYERLNGISVDAPPWKGKEALTLCKLKVSSP